MTTPFIRRGIWRSQWPTLAAGTAAAPALTFTGDLDTGVFSPTANTFAISTGGTERLRFDASGNLGLGVTPSAWFSDARAIQFGQAGSLEGRTNDNVVHLQANAYINSSFNSVYLQTAAASRYQQENGVHTWWNAPSGTAGTAITFTQAMTLDASGNLILGATAAAPSAQLTLSRTSSTCDFVILAASSSQAGFRFGRTNATYQGRLIYDNASNYMAFSTNGAEKARLDASGNLGLGTTSFGTSAEKVLAIGSGAEPTTGPADTIQIYSVDLSAGNTIPAIYCEGSGVTNAAITNVTVTNKIALKVNGTVYYLLATTSAS